MGTKKKPQSNFGSGITNEGKVLSLWLSPADGRERKKFVTGFQPALE
jgi:hypothetical protein